MFGDRGMIAVSSLLTRARTGMGPGRRHWTKMYNAFNLSEINSECAKQESRKAIRYDRVSAVFQAMPSVSDSLAVGEAPPFLSCVPTSPRKSQLPQPISRVITTSWADMHVMTLMQTARRR